MLENVTIARPYATAVFELAQESQQVAEWSSMLDLLGLLVSDPDMRRLIFNPKVSSEQLQELIFDVYRDGLSDTGRNLVKILVQAERLQYAPQIKQLYEQMRADAEGRLEVEVVTAYELDQQQQDTIAGTISARLGKQVNIVTSIDQSLIGGAVIRAGDSIIDASLRGRLTEMRNQLS